MIFHCKIFAAAVAIGCLFWSSAAAQEYPSPAEEQQAQEESETTARPASQEAYAPPSDQFERSGFWASLGLGYGSLDLGGDTDRIHGAAGGVAMGGTITPQFLLGGSTYNWARSENGLLLSVGTLKPVVRYYPMVDEHLYLIGGFGLGLIMLEFPDGSSVELEGVGGMVGVGYDILVGDSWAITPFLHGVLVSPSDTDSANFLQLAVSVTWH